MNLEESIFLHWSRRARRWLTWMSVSAFCHMNFVQQSMDECSLKATAVVAVDFTEISLGQWSLYFIQGSKDQPLEQLALRVFASRLVCLTSAGNFIFFFFYSGMLLPLWYQQSVHAGTVGTCDGAVHTGVAKYFWWLITIIGGGEIAVFQLLWELHAFTEVPVLQVLWVTNDKLIGRRFLYGEAACSVAPAGIQQKLRTGLGATVLQNGMLSITEQVFPFLELEGSCHAHGS